MWCWHRIRSEASENETALCPACRTPYGDDPHEFSALDLADVIKANKEKAAAEKREKEKRMQEQGAAAAAGLVMSEHHFPSLSDGGSVLASLSSQQIAQQDSSATSNSIPTIVVNSNLSNMRSSSISHHSDSLKDRSSLANMRVIRRNLVYAVGLPPSIANEDLLKKSEYFGQYGKISKIVLNRSNISGVSNSNLDGNSNRRSSASAYVTFAHKEDTLACILALDGFYLDNRNIRASYGTSKYCSAFIKNVRCNNPDCTYLHVLGENEDTFTKQEIQAGYVTSGRDVLAKQQQQLASVTGGNSGKRRVGGGGPSGTGKVSAHPVFPPPTFDEPEKPQPRVRANLARAASLPNQAPMSATSSVSSASSDAIDIKPAIRTITAASIVASSTGPAQPKPTQNSKPTLTPLKPVTRSVSLPVTSAKQGDNLNAKVKVNSSTNAGINNMIPSNIGGPAISSSSTLANQLNQSSFAFSNMDGGNGNSLLPNINVTSQTSETGLGSSIGKGHNPTASFGSVGSEISGLSLSTPFDAPIGSISATNMDSSRLDQSNQWNMPPVSSTENAFSSGMLVKSEGSGNSIWGAVGGPASINSPWSNGTSPGRHNPFSSNAVIGSLNSQQQLPLQGGTQQQSSGMGNNAFVSGSMLGSNDGLWKNGQGLADSTVSNANSGLPSSSLFSNANNGKELGGLGSNGLDASNGSSALASILGISLPTGTGSLREISTSGGFPSADPFNSSSISSLQQTNGYMHSQAPSLWNDQYVQTKQSSAFRSSNTPMHHGAIGSLGGSVGGNMGTDVAMLQTLLPGVQITSNDATQPARSTWGNTQSWNSGVSAQNGQAPGPSIENKNDPWGNGGLYGSNQNQATQNGKGIW